MSRPPAQASLPAGFLSHASLQRSEANRSEGQGQLLTEGGVPEETTQGPGTLWGSWSPPLLHWVTSSERNRNLLRGRQVQVSACEGWVFPWGHAWALEGPQSASCSPAQRGSSGCWDLPLWVTSTSEPRMGGVVSPRQLPAAPHPCPNLCPLFSTRLGCFFCPISRWFSPTFSVKSLQQSPSLVSEEPWAQGWSGLGQEKAGLRGQMERDTQLGTQR